MRLSADGQVSTGHTHALDTHRPHRHSTATKESGVAGGARTTGVVLHSFSWGVFLHDVRRKAGLTCINTCS